MASKEDVVALFEKLEAYPGIGKDVGLALLQKTQDFNEIAEGANVLNDAIMSAELAEQAAEKTFFESRQTEFNESRDAARTAAFIETARRHAPKPVDEVVEAEPVDEVHPGKANPRG